jgi:UPF0271 protein
MTLQIDINCDMGESFGLYTYGHDADMLPLISSPRPKDLGPWHQ